RFLHKKSLPDTVIWPQLTIKLEQQQEGIVGEDGQFELLNQLIEFLDGTGLSMLRLQHTR
ncbi:MAG TPA: hypothetical protein VJ036_00265, partial [bacterium]|nr:hypothetical protein [bacterium]